MGAGIAQVAAVAGHDVTLQDVSDEALSRGRRQVEDSLARFEAKGRIAPEARTEALERFSTTTSAIPITAIAAATGRPESVVGTHFFSPVPMMALCELVRGRRTSDETLARAKAFAEACGKTTVVVQRDIAGFVTTRIIAAVGMEAARLLEQGVISAEY